MKPKAESMVKFGWVMLGVYLLAAGGFWLHDHKSPRVLMFLVGSIVWIICIFIWARNAKHGD